MEKIETTEMLLEGIKSLSALIDFGCSNCEREEKRCCDQCVQRLRSKKFIDEHGYFGWDSSEEAQYKTRDVDTYKSYWNKETGYWRKDIGCILPRELRSFTCLAHKCSEASRLDNEHRKVIALYKTILEESIKEYICLKKLS